MSAASRDQVPADSGTAAQDTERQGDSREVTEDESGEAGGDLPLDQVFEILKNRRRREVLQYLRESEGEVTLGEVAEHIAAIENDTTVDAISSSERKRVYVGLYQCHLPKMDDMNIVSFNQNRGRIELARNAAQLEPFIEQESEETREWYRYYAGAALGGGALYAGTTISGLSSGLTTSVIVFGLVVAIGVIAAAHNVAVNDDDSDE